MMTGVVCSSVVSDAVAAARKDACKAIDDFKSHPMVYVEFAAKADELKNAINKAETIIEINRIMKRAHAKDRWDLA